MLHQHPHCTDFLHDFLDLVEKDMLVANTTDRIDAVGCVSRLEDMTTRCRNDSRYWSQPKPRIRTLRRPQHLVAAPVNESFTDEVVRVSFQATNHRLRGKH